MNVDKAHYFNSKGQAVAAYPARSTNSVEKAAEASYLAGVTYSCGYLKTEAQPKYGYQVISHRELRRQWMYT
ncbi:MAG: hypothetical protein IPN89_10910 [Saprospiraceae bacterium]|nr:hypothetical protein [Saprospiraceae bacterium]